MTNAIHQVIEAHAEEIRDALRVYSAEFGGRLRILSPKDSDVLPSLLPQTSPGQRGRPNGDGRLHEAVVAVDEPAWSTVGEALDRLREIGSMIIRDGFVLLGVDTLAAPGEGTPHSNLLFPHLDDGTSYQSALSASTWRLAMLLTGFDILRVWGEGDQTLPAAFREHHEARLAVFNEVELRTAALVMLLQFKGPAQ